MYQSRRMSEKCNKRNTLNKNRVLKNVEKFVRENIQASVTLIITSVRKTTTHIFNKDEEPITLSSETYKKGEKRRHSIDDMGQSVVKLITTNEDPLDAPHEEQIDEIIDEPNEKPKKKIRRNEKLLVFKQSKITVIQVVDPKLPIKLWELNSVRDFHNMRSSVDGKWIAHTFIRNMGVLEQWAGKKKLQEFITRFNEVVRNYYQTRYGELISVGSFCCIRNERSRIICMSRNNDTLFALIMQRGTNNLTEEEQELADTLCEEMKLMEETNEEQKASCLVRMNGVKKT